MRRALTLVVLLFVLSGCGGSGGVGVSSETVTVSPGGASDPIIGGTAVAPMEVAAGDEAPRYIVVLKDGQAVDSVTRAYTGLRADVEFRDVLNGFAGQMDGDTLAALRSDPRVAYVEPDQVLHATAQTLPLGVKRVGASLSLTAKINNRDERVNVGVAVVDTGVQLNHPDLNVKSGASFVTGVKTPADDNGHGTHVAGIIGALDNTAGVVGVAPGATIWAVKVLDKNGSGYVSAIINGLSWVKANAASKGIRVVNLSLGGGASTSLDDAVRALVAANITVVVAAGNESADAANSSPARVAEAITVSALIDSNGLAGGGGPTLTMKTSDGSLFDFPDDTFARIPDRTGTKRCYSNYGTVVDIMAPGTNIYSTYKGSAYAYMTGTSMAAPHVAGGAALVLAKNPAFTPAQVLAALTANGTKDYTYKGAQDDPDGVQEPLLNVRSF